jgi:hypothetical protein
MRAMSSARVEPVAAAGVVILHIVLSTGSPSATGPFEIALGW